MCRMITVDQLYISLLNQPLILVEIMLIQVVLNEYLFYFIVAIK